MILTDVVHSVWSVSVLRHAKTDEPIEMLFGVQMLVDLRHFVLDGGSFER